MTLKQSWVSRAVRALKVGSAGILVLATAGGLTAGCLDRPVAPATPRTSNVVVKTVTRTAVDKIDLLFMIDNSISMADKQRILAEAVPVLVRRLVDPICVDDDENPSGDDSSANGCMPGVPEFPPIRNIHVGVITSSLGNHGGDVCVPVPEDMPPRTLNDQAQLIGTVRTGLYSYASQGFLAWDPRTGTAIPVPDPHPGKGQNETDVNSFITDFTAHVQATGERGCGYEASLEAWYRFLIDPEPINTVTVDTATGFSLRGAVNPLVITQRGLFMRPDSLLAIVMLTDENDCSINDENNAQGWLVGRQPSGSMVRASSSCATNPNDPCCRPCVVGPAAGCPDNGSDVECQKGDYLTPQEDSTNLRCFNQVQRFGLSLLYPWQRYVEGLTQPRLRLRNPGMNGETEVSNPLYTPGLDGTPAREQGLVFLAGIIGVPWQDIADEASLTGAGLRYLTSAEMDTAVPNRWQVILGDPDMGVAPLDPFMIETVNPRAGANPITGDMILPPAPGSNGNEINGHEQNIINRDDLQYACTFDLNPDVPCTMTNQDGCDCNGSEEPYNRPLCDYPGGGADGTQTHAKAYPGVRHLQVLRGYGENAIVASICPKNVMSSNPQGDPSYGYNPAVSAIINRLKEALVGTCLPRPLDTTGTELPCKVVEAFLPGSDGVCACNLEGRTDLSTDKIRASVEDELIAGSLCGGTSEVPCDRYCMCEIQQFTGAELSQCQTDATDNGMINGYCYVDSTSPAADVLLADCPESQQQIIRFMGPDVPRPRAVAFIACLGGTVQSDAGTGM
jgi:hypothetical protein